MKTTAIEYKEDSREKKNGWAPGEYLHICNRCDDGFIGDKRAHEQV